MLNESWEEAIRKWRALPEREKRRRRLLAIPDNIAKSFAFEGEPLPQEVIENMRQEIRETLRREGLLDSGEEQPGPENKANE